MSLNRILLVIDDDPSILEILRRAFERAGWEVLTALDARTALDRYGHRDVDVILQDLDLPGLSGLELVKVLLQRFPDAAVMVLTGTADVRSAVEALHIGADNFLAKPPDLAHLLALAERAFENGRLRRENRRLSQGHATLPSVDSLRQSPSLTEVAAGVRSVASTDTTVLIQGETGTGKGRLARLIHRSSDRARHPFVEINCAGLEATLLASELFGHERGAFTGAHARKLGLFEVAHRGTLFLDEIGELHPQLQPKLLTVLENQSFRRVGGTVEITTNVRIIAATNRPLQDDAAEGRFREDLYFRLSTFPLTIPPLRDRSPEDLVHLTHDLLKQLMDDRGRSGTPAIADKTFELLMAHPWPGNVRELRNVLERALIMAPGAEVLRPEHFSSDLQRMTSGARPRSAESPDGELLPLAEVERRHVLRVLEAVGGNRSEAARVLGIGRRTLYDRLKAWSGDEKSR